MTDKESVSCENKISVENHKQKPIEKLQNSKIGKSSHENLEPLEEQSSKNNGIQNRELDVSCKSDEKHMGNPYEIIDNFSKNENLNNLFWLIEEKVNITIIPKKIKIKCLKKNE